MTIAQALSRLDAFTPNPYSREEKLQWLYRAEALTAREALNREPPQSFTPETGPETVLLAPAPYDELYLRYMQAQIFLETGEIARCNNALALFQTALSGLRRFRIRENAGENPNFTNF